MFGFLKSERSKLREAAKNWLYLGAKVYHFRKDELSDSELGMLTARIDELKLQLKNANGDNGKLKLALDDIESHLRKVGGTYYPRTSLGENVEFFFVAMIIYLGFTAFFIKPFKIPTNSMWPTYHGMTGEVWSAENEAPNPVARLFRFAAFGAKRKEIVAPSDGELLIPLIAKNNGTSFLVEPVSMRRYFVLPGTGLEYSFRIGSEKMAVKVPADFDFYGQALQPALYPELSRQLAENPTLRSATLILKSLSRKDQIADTERISHAKHGMVDVLWMKTGKFFKKGEPIISFDILTGDQLFVDRMSYHFVSPEVGDGFVFKTGNIRRLGEDKFYIKRLAGLPGDVLKIDNGALTNNGEPIEGSVAFGLNADKTNPYRGYKNEGYLGRGIEWKVVDNSFVALGDNSYNSRDSRDWGFVPEADVVGRPLVIYYPFTKRFGLSK